ncbi:pyrroloquinoline quinone biosynthesis protein PqqE [Motiliproteus sp. MSK22-1]|uniref:pyrroloquinoline quinone biosynthesis protein PqqE n=1 Tax=Motiliproteus sp. MSK22-1 TaxID=1897630 RepID=UPI000975D02B|nr:pyrroloquinoline quinone biosynthesis protein PqqE [Motiliproteus sp. MSK22-1]OMH39627.1 pyrroloquinoline quinone biosynthesis protein PqqE [Motiliproteus sp. MSK22-1]
MTKAGSELSIDGDGKPIWVSLELTYQCPLSCVFCSNPLDFESYQKGEMSAAEWKRVIREARDMGAMQIGFTGGEPTLRKDLEELVGYANEIGFYTNLITSGIGLTATRLKVLKAAGLKHIQLGFQSCDENVANTLAGVDSAKLNSYRKKLAIAQEIKALGFPMVLNIPVTRQNLPQVPEILQLAEQLGVEYVELANVQYYNWALVNRDQLMPSREELEWAEAEVNRFRERVGDKMTIYFVIPDYFDGRPKACMNGWGSIHLTIAPDGSALPCSQARSLETLTFPSVRDHSLQWLWEESATFKVYRGNEWMKEPCRSCDEKEQDFGGCRCQALALTGDADNTDPACSKSPHHHIVQQAIKSAELARELKQPLLVREANSVVAIKRASKMSAANRVASEEAECVNNTGSTCRKESSCKSRVLSDGEAVE